MPKEYVEERDGGFWISGTRVSLDSIVCSFLRGASPESIAQSSPVLTLEEVYGAITYYLAHHEAVNGMLEKSQKEFDALRERPRAANPNLYKKLEEARHSTQASRR